MTKGSDAQDLVQLLNKSLAKENDRLARLGATSSGREKLRLEMRFNMERDREKRLIEMLKQEQNAMAKGPGSRKIQDINQQRVTVNGKPSIKHKVEQPCRETSNQQTHMPACRLNRTPVQEAAFLSYMTQKLHKTPHQHKSTMKTLTNANVLAHTKSEQNLLVQKCTLLKQLHAIVTQQQRLLQDDQMTVRSSVSSFHSCEPQIHRPPLSYRYVPFNTLDT
ncbi:hypothetical protein AC1031_017190 [Aphanomyces cochlioides]|nr:hypothetical protein AC1031_017190 [Aphanomyces cochlioides]